jgi:hypothetical protein
MKASAEKGKAKTAQVDDDNADMLSANEDEE